MVSLIVRINIKINHYCFTDLGFMLHGHHYGNNSIVNIEEIGEGSSCLLCLTNNIQCCFPSDLRRLNITYPYWYFPNGEYVRIYGSFDSFYRNRGPSVVRLHHRYNSTMPNGVFYCNIPDINGTFQNIYVGIYSLENGKLAPAQYIKL